MKILDCITGGNDHCLVGDYDLLIERLMMRLIFLLRSLATLPVMTDAFFVKNI